MMMQLQEHEQLVLDGVPVDYDERFNGLELVAWDKPMPKCPWGYYASFKIGAEWTGDGDAIVVTPKKGVEHIDFLRMFMACFSSDAALDSFAHIYKIDVEAQAISAPALASVVSPLVVVHFIGVVSRIKSLKKGYVRRLDNLKKVKGRVRLLENERKNIAAKRYDRICCEYDEYSVDIPENRLLKKALVFSQTLVDKMGRDGNSAYAKIRAMVAAALARFEGVGESVGIRSVGRVRQHKLFSEYSEAMRLAKIILKRFDYSISKVGTAESKVPPFVLDMSLLYEHYVYGLLYEAYRGSISYQFEGATGKPDFLYKSATFKAILDTKYIPKYENAALDNNVVRQLSGYARDLLVLRHLGYDGIGEASPTPQVPCVIIYPEEGDGVCNPFKRCALSGLCSTPVRNLSMFYKICVPVPTVGV